MPDRLDKDAEGLVAGARELKNAHYLLTLYVAGMTPRSADAIQRVTTFLEQNLPGRYDLEIVDIYQKPALVRGEQIIAVPTLIRRLPSPLRRLIGDMHSEQKLLFGLDLKRTNPREETG